MRSRLLTGVTMFAVLASGPAPLPLAIANARTIDPQQGFCRNAGPLPRLDPEVRPQPQQNDGPYKTRGGRDRGPRRDDSGDRGPRRERSEGPEDQGHVPDFLKD